MKILKKLSILSFLWFVTSNNAQEIKLGIRTGIGIPNLSTNADNIYSSGYSSVPGFDGSIFGEIGVTEKFSIKAEVGYSRKGGERNGVQPIPPTSLERLESLVQGKAVWAKFDNRAVFTYITIPLIAKYKWNLNSSWDIYANGGVYLDLIQNPKQITKSDGAIILYFDEAQKVPVSSLIPLVPAVDISRTTDVKDQVASVDYGMLVGGGVSKAISQHSELFFDIRGSFGFVPLQKNTDLYGKINNGNLVFSLGYAYTIHKSKKTTAID